MNALRQASADGRAGPTVEGKHVSGVGCSRIAMRPKPIIAGFLLAAVAVVFLG